MIERAAISREAMLAEIEELRAGERHHLAVVLTAEQMDFLLAARPGNGGLQWKTVMRAWRAKGWPGSESTLRRIYREAVAVE